MANPLTITAEDIERAINQLKQYAAQPPYHIYFIGGADQGIPNKEVIRLYKNRDDVILIDHNGLRYHKGRVFFHG